MLFDHTPRFQEQRSEGDKVEGNSPPMLPQKSTLSTKGTRIVDSYVQRPIDSRYETNLIMKNGVLFHAQNDSPDDMFKYSPNQDFARPRVICPQWTETERFPPLVLTEAAKLGPYTIKGDFDKIPPQCQSPVKFFGSADRHLRFVKEHTHCRPHGSCLSAESSVYEEPSFTDFTYCSEESDEGTFMSLESLDRSYRAIQQNPSVCKIGGIDCLSVYLSTCLSVHLYLCVFICTSLCLLICLSAYLQLDTIIIDTILWAEKLRPPPPDNFDVPGPGRYDVQYPPSRQVGICIKGRLPTAAPRDNVPGEWRRGKGEGGVHLQDGWESCGTCVCV